MLASANISLIADINNQIKELQVLNPKLEEYYKHFNMALHNVCIAASAVSSGLVVPDSGHLERISASSWVKWVCYLGDIAASGFLSPIVTALIAVLHDAGDNIFNSKEEKKLVDVLTKFCKMINKQSNMTVSIEQDLQRLALFFANLRSAEIKKTNGTDFSNFFTTKLPLQGNFFRYDTNNTDEMNSNPMEKLALQDAISLIGYMYHNAENILKNSKSLLNQIITTAKEGLSTSWEEIRKTTPGTVENDLWQIEKQVPESEIITEKAKIGQLRSVKISCVSVDLSKPLLKKIGFSSTGIRRGVEDFLIKNILLINLLKKNKVVLSYF